MTRVDWMLVIGVNGLIIAYGLLRARTTMKSIDWFLAARGLPWWVLGLSMFATAVDSGDYVAIAGASYQYGLSYLTQWWLGLPIAWFVAAYFIFLPMYRVGAFTNAEYLEYRFGPTARVLSVLIQIQYRTNVLGNIAYSTYLVLDILTDWTTQGTWCAVVLIAFGASLYTASGGLRSVAVTDALQSIVMLAASVILWITVWNAVGGWNGLENKLNESEAGLADALVHVGGYTEPGVPTALILIGWIIVLNAYCMVNHSQSMRMLAARSEWDMRMAAVVAGAITVIVMWFNITIGIMGRALNPGFGGVDGPGVDEIFPHLIQQHLGMGLLGLVVAGLLAGGISTYDSIGSALSALFTRDLYARFLVKYREDRHYLTVARLSTFVIIGASFAYIPFLKSGMANFYLSLIRVTVIPLFVVTMMGALTRVNRVSGSVGLCVGILYGLSSFLGDAANPVLRGDVELPFPKWLMALWHAYSTWMPTWWTNKWWAYLWSIALTASAMVVTSVWRGWATDEELGKLVYRWRQRGDEQDDSAPDEIPSTATWLEQTRLEVPRMPTYPFHVGARGLPWPKRPALWAWLLLGSVTLIIFFVLW